jgi:hypothetical protein
MKFVNGDAIPLYGSTVTFNETHRYCTELFDHGIDKVFLGHKCHEAIRSWREHMAYTNNHHNFMEADFMTEIGAYSNLETRQLSRDKNFMYEFIGKRVVDGKTIHVKAWTLWDLYNLFMDAVLKLNTEPMLEHNDTPKSGGCAAL